MGDSVLQKSGRDGATATPALDRIAELAARFTSSSTALVVLVGDEEQRVIGAGGPLGPDVPPTERRTHSLCRFVVAAGEPLIISDARRDDRVHDHPAVVERGVQAYAGVPLRLFDGTVVGSLCLVESEPRDWTQAEVDTLVDLAECASTQLSFAGLATDHEQDRRDLESVSAFHNAVLNSLSEGVAACDASGRLAYFNPALRRIHGLPDRDLTDADWAGAYNLYSADNERVLAAEEIPLARAFAGQDVRDQQMVVRADDGTARHFSASGGPIRADDGGLLGAVIAMRDTSLEVRQQRLRQAQLSAAALLARGTDSIDTVSQVLATLQGALFLTSADYVELPSAHEPVDDLVEQVRTSGRARHVLLGPASDEAVFALPVAAGEGVVGVLSLHGRRAELLDDLGTSFVLAVAAMFGHWREQQRVQALQLELASARAALGRVVEQIDDLVFCAELDDHGFVRTDFLSSSVGILGAELLPGTDWYALLSERVPDADRPLFATWLDDLRAGHESTLTCRLRGLDGRTRWVWTRSTVRVDNGRRFVDGICTDVTDRQQVAVEREELLRTRQQQLADLEALDRAKDEFVATVAHEIRGPLGMLATFADGLDRTVASADVDPATARKAHLVAANAAHLQQVVENIFELAKLDTHGVLRTESVSISDLLDELVEQYRFVAGEKDLTLVLDRAAGIEVAADRSRLRQAVENLLSNAVKYTPPGGSVAVRAGVDGAEAIVRITDTGIGIPADDVQHLFTRFYRASNAHASDTPGTGLGLAVARAVVDAHAGAIDVESRTGEGDHGTTFTIRLPAAPAG